MSGAARALAAIDSEALLSLGETLLPGVLVALAALLLVLFGVSIGRRVAPRSLRRIENALRRLIAGDYGVAPEVAPRDPVAPTAALIGELSERLQEKTKRLEHRSVMVGQAIERIADRGVLVLDRELRIVAAGEGLARLVGSPPGDLEGRHCSALFSEDSWGPFVVPLLDHEQRRGGVVGRLRLLRAAERAPLPVHAIAVETSLPPDGLAVYLEAAEPQDAAGANGVLGFERLSALFDGFAEGLVVVREGVIRSANPAARRWLGEEAAGRLLRDLVAAEDLLLVQDRVARAERGEKAAPFRARLEPSDPELRLRTLEIRPLPLEFDDGPAAILTMRDAGAELRARRRELIEQARLLAVVDAAADGLFVLDAPDAEPGEWRLALLNARARELLDLPSTVGSGTREDALRGRIAHRFRDPVALLAFFDRSREQAGRELVESFDLSGEAPRTFELVSRSVAGPAGECVSRVIVIRDISRHREAERRLRSEADALRQSHVSLQQAFEELAAINESMGSKADELDAVNRELRDVDLTRAELIASVAHELQTPLVSVRGYAQMVLEQRLGDVNEQQQVALDKVLRNVDRMSDLIGNLLAMSRAEASADLKAASLPVRDVIEEVVERHRPAAEARRVTVEVESVPGSLTVLAEQEGLIQVLDNLVGNAVKFNRDGGAVRISAREGPERFAEISVEDSGVGIPEDEMDRVFDRFFRGRNAAGRHGSGIGLATVQAIVSRHGGRIRCNSRAGQGTTFTVLWPRDVAVGSAS